MGESRTGGEEDGRDSDRRGGGWERLGQEGRRMRETRTGGEEDGRDSDRRGGGWERLGQGGAVHSALLQLAARAGPR